MEHQSKAIGTQVSFYYVSSLNAACTHTHSWHRSYVRPGFWYVLGFSQWNKSGYAVVDDYGDLAIVDDI